MKVIKKSLILLCLLVISAKCAPNWMPGFLRTKTKATTTTVKPPVKTNETLLGRCEDDEHLVYIDDTRLESNDAQLAGTIEVYLESPYTITCVKLIDYTMNLALNHTGAEVLGVAEGGYGHKFIKINVLGEYGRGLHFKIYVWGNLMKEADEKIVK